MYLGCFCVVTVVLLFDFDVKKKKTINNRTASKCFLFRSSVVCVRVRVRGEADRRLDHLANRVVRRYDESGLRWISDIYMSHLYW